MFTQKVEKLFTFVLHSLLSWTLISVPLGTGNHSLPVSLQGYPLSGSPVWIDLICLVRWKSQSRGDSHFYGLISVTSAMA